MEIDSGDLNQGGRSGGGYMLIVELLVFVDNLDVVYKSKRGVQDDLKDFGLSKLIDEVFIYNVYMYIYICKYDNGLYL